MGDCTHTYCEGFESGRRTACVVMASGHSQRFGAQKLLALLAGRPVLDWVLHALPYRLLDVVVVVTDRDVAAVCDSAGVPHVLHNGASQSDTIRCGLNAVGDAQACLFVPGDMPLLAKESIVRIVEEGRSHPGCVVRLAWQQTVRTPTLFPAECFDGLRALEGDVGGWALLRHRPRLQAQLRTVQAGASWELEDVDSQEDLARVRALVQREGLVPGAFDGDVCVSAAPEGI